MHMIPVSPVSSAELAVAVLAAVPMLASVIIRMLLCVLAAAATRKALEDPADGQGGSDALRAHRLAVLRTILAALSVRDSARSGENDSPLVARGPEQPALQSVARETSETDTRQLSRRSAEYSGH